MKKLLLILFSSMIFITPSGYALSTVQKLGEINYGNIIPYGELLVTKNKYNYHGSKYEECFRMKSGHKRAQNMYVRKSCRKD